MPRPCWCRARPSVVNIYRSWVGERAKRDLRQQVGAAAAAPGSGAPEAQGTAVSMIVTEVEPIGSFIGESVSEPLLQAGVLATVLAYIVHLNVWMAVAAIALFVPQLVFVPLHAARDEPPHRCARVSVLRQMGAGT